ncbi:MAG TPA: hemerythrin domain-containing protein [Vicinamibacterales bacterium]|nr:hemerythrin domain-containing protein [Vicinamibacterales bacterium]
MAKRTSRKQTKPSRKSAGNTGRTRGAARKKATPARRAKTATARRKTAARAAATRTTRRRKPPEPSRLSSAKTAVKGAVANAVAAVARRLPGASADVDAITLLETDHRRLQDLLKRGEDTTDRARTARRDLLNTITAELAAHELIEEQLLYPALKQYPEAREIVLEGFQEHHVADLIVKELHAVATDDERWGAKFKVLKENIEHHIQEEEGPMFRTARGVMSREELQALGTQMARMKAEAARR